MATAVSAYNPGEFTGRMLMPCEGPVTGTTADGKKRSPTGGGNQLFLRSTTSGEHFGILFRISYEQYVTECGVLGANQEELSPGGGSFVA